MTLTSKGLCDMANITPRVFADIEINGEVYTIHEGSKVCNLTYTQNYITTTLTGRVRVINTAGTRVTYDQSCPPESYFGIVVDCPSIIIDTSNTYHADLHLVPIDAITRIGSVVDEDTHYRDIPIVDDVSDVDDEALRKNFLVFDRIEEE